MLQYAHRSALVSVERAEGDGWLDTMEGLQIITKGNLIATNEFGNKFVVDENYFYDTYIEVEKIEPKINVPKKSPFELEMEEAYKQSWVSPEEDQYINGTYEISKNK